MPEVAAEPVEPEPSEAFAEAEAEGEAPPADAASSDAADMAGEEQEAQASEFFFDWTPPSFAHLSIPGGEDGVDDAGSNDDAGSGRTRAATQGAETERASTSAIFSAEDKPEAASNDQSGVGSAEREEVRGSVPAVEEPVVRLQRDPVVMRAQTLLTRLDFYRAKIDGLLGERTITAIRDFQKSMSMAETGKVSEALLEALEAQASAARSDISDGPREQSAEDAAVEAAEMLQVIDIMDECRGKEAEWIYIPAINRHVLCGGLSAGSPN
jgi:hypothetical protein